MENLIKLLNEYEQQRERFWNFDSIIDWKTWLSYKVIFLWKYEKIYFLISKKYGFIKRLVKNNKIDAEWLNYKYMDVVYELECAYLVSKESRIEYLTDFIYMLLSVQEDPIEFLLSLLKECKDQKLLKNMWTKRWAKWKAIKRKK